LKVEVANAGGPCTGKFVFEPIRKNVPAGLWGTMAQTGLQGDRLVEDVLSGFEIKPVSQQIPDDSVDLDCSQLNSEPSERLLNLPEKIEFQVPFGSPPVSAAIFRDPGGKVEASPTPRAAAEQEERVRREKIKGSLARNSARRETMLAALGFSKEKITLSEKAADDFMLAPQIEA
jgi:hypothetical protein